MKVFDVKELGYRFWLRVDELRGFRRCQLIDMAREAGIDYTIIKNQRSANRLPKLEDAYQIARVLDSSVSYLLTGMTEEDNIPRKLQPIIQALTTASEEDLELVRRVLRIEDDAPKSKDA